MSLMARRCHALLLLRNYLTLKPFNEEQTYLMAPQSLSVAAFLHDDAFWVPSTNPSLTFLVAVGAMATVPRMYHSVASLVYTGAIITAGSNPQGQYAFQSDPATGVFPSELRVEYYYPWWVPAISLTLLTCLFRSSDHGNANM